MKIIDSVKREDGLDPWLLQQDYYWAVGMAMLDGGRKRTTKDRRVTLRTAKYLYIGIKSVTIEKEEKRKRNEQ